MDNFYKSRKRGFTLVELLIAMAVGTVIMAAVYAAMNLALRFSANTDRKVITQQDTRAVLDLMAMEIRMASYNPLNTTNTWSSASPLACMPNVPITYKGIKSANANSIAVAMDLNNDGVIGCSCGACCGPPNTCTNPTCAGANEYIVYSYDGADTITRSVSCGNNFAILGGTAPYSNVRNAAVLPTPISLFQYFDKNDNEITNTVNNNNSPVNGIPAIRRILITIVTDTVANDTTTGQPRRMIYSTKVIVRNHALSP
jgi:prepilin-type N-terminal cleavage/methylation domain-containing protein